MKLKFYLFFIIIFSSSTIILSQNFSPENNIKLEHHGTDSSKFIVKLYSKNTGKLIEYWVMSTSVTDITSENYNKLLSDKNIWPNGKFYKFYPNSKLRLEANYTNGTCIGEITGYYNTGEIHYMGIMNVFSEEKLVYYYKNGIIKKSEILARGKTNGKVEAFYPNGEKQFIANYENGKRNGLYQSFYKNGKTKRKAKFKHSELISSKCFNNEGDKTECSPFYSSPVLQTDIETLIDEIKKFDFSFNSENNDTIEFKIILKTDSLGNPILSSYSFDKNDSIFEDVMKMTKKLSRFNLAYVDDFFTPYLINISFPICKNEVLWLGDAMLFRSESEPHGDAGISDYEVFNLENKFIFNIEFPVPTSSEIFLIVHDMPIFEGGELALRKYISTRLRYPPEAQKKGIEGKVFVTFIIDKEGFVRDVRATNSVHYLLDAEAIRVVKYMPKWEPAKIMGEPVHISFTVPINFVLTKPLWIRNP